MRTFKDESSSSETGYIHEWSSEFLRRPKNGVDSNIKLYPELNKLDQKDERLISFIKTNILIKPPSMRTCKEEDYRCSNMKKRPNTNRPILQNGMSYHNLGGQYEQPKYVEQLLNLKNRKRKTSMGGKNTAELKDILTLQRPVRRDSSKANPLQCNKVSFYELMEKPHSPDQIKLPRGFFIEAGASDGETISNSLYFEIKYGWSGLLVEPNPDYHDALLSKRRNAWILPHCLSTRATPEIVDFFADLALGGIINKENGALPHGNSTSYDDLRRVIQVQCFPLYSVLKAIGNPLINYFSLDIEGPEFQVLKTIPWELVNIDVLGIETKHAGEVFEGSESKIIEFLNTVGYRKTKKTGCDTFFKRSMQEIR